MFSAKPPCACACLACKVPCQPRLAACLPTWSVTMQAQPGLVRAHERLITCHQRIGQFAAARECITRLHSLPDGRASAIAAGSEVDSLQQRCTQVRPCHSISPALACMMSSCQCSGSALLALVPAMCQPGMLHCSPRAALCHHTASADLVLASSCAPACSMFFGRLLSDPGLTGVIGCLGQSWSIWHICWSRAAVLPVRTLHKAKSACTC